MVSNISGTSPSLKYAALAIIMSLTGALTAALSPSPIPMIALLAVSLLFLMMQNPGMQRVELAFFGIVVLCSTIIDIDTLPLIPIGVGSLNPADIILVILAGAVIVRWLLDPTFHPVNVRLKRALGVFFALAILSVINALIEGSGSRHRILSELRTLTFYLLLVIVPQYIRSRRQFRFLLRGLAVLAVGSALIMLAQAFLGPTVELIPTRLVSVNTSVYAETGLFRVTPPAQALIRAVLVLLVAEWLLTSPNERSKWLLPTMIVIGLGLLVTSNRNYWLGTALSIGLALTVIDARSRFTALRSGIRVLLVCGGIGVIVFVVAEIMQIRLASQLLETTLLRLDSDSEVANTESSLGTRQEELYYIFEQFESHPVFGIGLGANYKPLRWYETPEFNRQYYTHNAYLWILMKMGLSGFLAFIWLTFGFLQQTLTTFKRPNSALERSVILGSGVLYVGLLFSAPFSPVFMEWFWTPLIGLTMGLSEAALHLEHSR